jgi:hypothetical protein
MNDEFRTLNHNLGVQSDPIHAMLVRRRNGEVELPPIVKHNEHDLLELKEFCQRHGIIGTNFGNMSPRAALNMLKSRFGESMKPQKVLLKG